MIMGDDIGWFNPSSYNRGIMGYRTPNIDRIAKEGALFTDWYGEQSCTAGRAAFITGQSPIRTGLTKVGLPGADIGLQPEDPSVAEFLKPLGYATGQFGKNHLGDKDEFLPTEPRLRRVLRQPLPPQRRGGAGEPRLSEGPGVPQAVRPARRASTLDAPTARSRTPGRSTKKRMETVDEEFLAAALDFIDRQHKAGKPWFCYFNSTRMHVCTHLKPEVDGKTGLGRLSRRHGRARRPCRPAAEEARRSRRRATTPSSSTPPTTAPR